MKRSHLRQRPVPRIAREDARDLVRNPPALPNPFDIGSKDDDRWLAETPAKERKIPKDWKNITFLPDYYPAPQLFGIDDLEYLIRWEEAASLDLEFSSEDRDVNLGLGAGVFSGFMFALATAIAQFWNSGKDARIAAGTLLAVSILVAISGAVMCKVPYRRINRLHLIQIHYARRRRELEHYLTCDGSSYRRGHGG